MKRILVGVMAFITFFAAVSFAACGAEDGAEPAFITGDTVESDSNTGDLIIPLSELTADAQFYGITVEGVYMEVIAIKSGTSYRTAFNTCQVCYGSRTAYYKQSGSYLVCQNCGSRFALSYVGLKTSSYTCNPYPILDTDRTIDEKAITISYEFLVKAINLFKTWKVT